MCEIHFLQVIGLSTLRRGTKSNYITYVQFIELSKLLELANSF